MLLLHGRSGNRRCIHVFQSRERIVDGRRDRLASHSCIPLLIASLKALVECLSLPLHPIGRRTCLWLAIRTRALKGGSDRGSKLLLLLLLDRRGERGTLHSLLHRHGRSGLRRSHALGSHRLDVRRREPAFLAIVRPPPPGTRLTGSRVECSSLREGELALPNISLERMFREKRLGLRHSHTVLANSVLVTIQSFSSREANGVGSRRSSIDGHFARPCLSNSRSVVPFQHGSKFFCVAFIQTYQPTKLSDAVW